MSAPQPPVTPWKYGDRAVVVGGPYNEVIGKSGYVKRTINNGQYLEIEFPGTGIEPAMLNGTLEVRRDDHQA